MKITLKLFLAAAPMAIAIFACSEPALARGGAANIMNSPGYAAAAAGIAATIAAAGTIHQPAQAETHASALMIDWLARRIGERSVCRSHQL